MIKVYEANLESPARLKTTQLGVARLTSSQSNRATIRDLKAEAA